MRHTLDLEKSNACDVVMLHGVARLLIIWSQTSVVPLAQAIRNELVMNPGARDR